MTNRMVAKMKSNEKKSLFARQFDAEGGADDVIDCYCAPFVSSGMTTGKIMLDVIIAFLPALVWSVYIFGVRALVITLISVVSCVLLEVWGELLFKRRSTLTDLSAVVSGMILAFTLPVSVSLYVPVIGALIAMTIKLAFGGIGCNPVNPAVSAHLILSALFAECRSDILPFTKWSPLAISTGEISQAVEAKSNLDLLYSNTIPQYSLPQLFLGEVSGKLGEISALMLLIGFVWLLFRRVVKTDTTVGCLIGFLAVICIYPRYSITLQSIGYELLCGGFCLMALFCINDYSTTPVTYRGKLLYGMVCGLLTALFRYKFPFDDGAYFALIVTNLIYFAVKGRADIVKKFL